MSDVIFKTFVTFFVIYALIDMFTRIFRFFAEERTRSEVIVVIRVKNQEENIEGVIRSVIWKFLSRSAGGEIPFILIVDTGSTDSTEKIARKLCDDYGFIYYMTEEKYNEMKEQLPI